MDSSRVFSLWPGFPEGLRVLLVDDDSASLTLLEELLKKCKCEVTCTSSAEEAVKMLGERKDWFEIVMCDVKEDVFMFVEHVHKLDIPLIMISCDGDPRRMVRGFEHGACDYLLKPLPLEKLKTIWIHVYRRKKLINGQHSRDHDQDQSILSPISNNDNKSPTISNNDNTNINKSPTISLSLLNLRINSDTDT